MKIDRKQKMISEEDYRASSLSLKSSDGFSDFRHGLPRCFHPLFNEQFLLRKIEYGNTFCVRLNDNIGLLELDLTVLAHQNGYRLSDDINDRAYIGIFDVLLQVYRNDNVGAL